MKFSEEQIKEIVALRESMLQQIDKHQEGIEMLEKNITVLDAFLKESTTKGTVKKVGGYSGHHLYQIVSS